MSGSDGLPQGELIRLNKYLARCGFGSRRSVEALITARKVFLNGTVVTDLGRKVRLDGDTVTVEGRPAVLPHDFRVYAFHKPFEVVCTLKSQGGQPALSEFRLRADIADRFMPVGRLDADSTGLLLWTDDGQLNQDLCSPRAGLWKTYEIDVNDRIAPTALKNLTQGRIEIDGRKCRPCRLAPRPEGTTLEWVMEVHEGRRRQIRRMFRKVGLKVLRLHRVAVGPVGLGLLRPGDFRRLTPAEVKKLRDAVAAGDRRK